MIKMSKEPKRSIDDIKNELTYSINEAKRQLAIMKKQKEEAERKTKDLEKTVEYYIETVKELQESEVKNGINGYFYISSTAKEPYKNISRGCMEFYAVSDLISLFPDHTNVPIWKDMVSQYANNYLQTFIKKNSFGIVPFGLYTEKDPGGDRKI